VRRGCPNHADHVTRLTRLGTEVQPEPLRHFTVREPQSHLGQRCIGQRELHRLGAREVDRRPRVVPRSAQREHRVRFGPEPFEHE